MRARLIGAAALLAVVVAVLGVLVGHKAPVIIDIDRSVGVALLFRGGGFGVDVLQVLTAPGSTLFRVVVLVPLVVVYAIRRHWRMVGFVVLAELVVGPLTLLLKDVVGRGRPAAEDPLVYAGGLSFPSGHSSGAACLAGILLVVLWPVVNRRWRPFVVAGLAVFALVVAWTRIALGVHYLSDTVGGLCLGAAVVLVSMAIFGVYPGGPGSRPVPGRPELSARSAGSD